MHQFSVESVFPTKSWGIGAGVGPLLLGHIASGQWLWCWKHGGLLLKLITLGTIYSVCPLPMRSSFARTGTDVSSLPGSAACFNTIASQEKPGHDRDRCLKIVGEFLEQSSPHQTEHPQYDLTNSWYLKFKCSLHLSCSSICYCQ